jgi:hypothetical protein
MNALIVGEGIIDLADRQNDRLNVTLWWVQGTMRTFVTVQDAKQSENFAIDVPEGENPMHYFHHPMVYSPHEYGQRKLYAATEGNQ